MAYKDKPLNLGGVISLKITHLKYYGNRISLTYSSIPLIHPPLKRLVKAVELRSAKTRCGAPYVHENYSGPKGRRFKPFFLPIWGRFRRYILIEASYDSTFFPRVFPKCWRTFYILTSCSFDTQKIFQRRLKKKLTSKSSIFTNSQL